MKVAPVKVYFFGKDQPLEVDTSKINQLKDLKKKLEEFSSLKPEEQKILKNNQVIKQSDDVPLQQLDLKSTDKVLLLAQKSQKLDEYKYLQKQQHKSKKSKELRTVNDLGKALGKKENFNKFLNSLVTKQVISKIIERLDLSHWRKIQKRLLFPKGVIRYLLYELREDKANAHDTGPVPKDNYDDLYEKRQVPNQLNNETWKIFEGVMCKGIIGCPLYEYEEVYEPPETYDKKILSELKVLGYYQLKCKQALHRAANNYYEALVCLSAEVDPKNFQLDNSEDESDEVLLYRELMSDKSRHWRVRFKLDINDLDIYFNSIKYRCPPLYEMARRNRRFILSLINLKPRPKPWTKKHSTSRKNSGDEEKENGEEKQGEEGKQAEKEKEPKSEEKEGEKEKESKQNDKKQDQK